MKSDGGLASNIRQKLMLQSKLAIKSLHEWKIITQFIHWLVLKKRLLQICPIQYKKEFYPSIKEILSKKKFAEEYIDIPAEDKTIIKTTLENHSPCSNEKRN